MSGESSERVSSILVGIVREMTAVNRDLAHEVMELRTEQKRQAAVVERVEAHLDENAKRAAGHSWIYKAGAAAVKLPGVPLASVALALWLARVLGVIEFIPNGGTP